MEGTGEAGAISVGALFAQAIEDVWAFPPAASKSWKYR
jgi:hypothetical protein